MASVVLAVKLRLGMCTITLKRFSVINILSWTLEVIHVCLGSALLLITNCRIYDQRSFFEDTFSRHGCAKKRTEVEFI